MILQITFWQVLIIIGILCLVVLGILLGKGLKSGRDLDTRIDDLMRKPEDRYKYPKE